MQTSQVSRRSLGGSEQVTSAVRAPSAWARPSAARTNGVVPLAAMPTTTSSGPTRRASISPMPGVDVVLRAFDRLDQRRIAAGDDADHHLRRRAERRRTLGRVEHAEPAAGARADVDQASAGAEGGLDQVHQRARSPRAPGDGAGHARVLGADEIDDLERGGGVDGGAAGIAPLGQARVEVVVSHAESGKMVSKRQPGAKLDRVEPPGQLPAFRSFSVVEVSVRLRRTAALPLLLTLAAACAGRGTERRSPPPASRATWPHTSKAIGDRGAGRDGRVGPSARERHRTRHPAAGRQRGGRGRGGGVRPRGGASGGGEHRRRRVHGDPERGAARSRRSTTGRPRPAPRAATCTSTPTASRPSGA